MKTFFAVAAVSTALFAAPVVAQAAPYTQSNQGTTYSTGSATLTVRMSNDYAGYQPQRGRIIPLANVVRDIERRTNTTLVDARLSANGKVYEYEGVNNRGNVVVARADAFTGKITQAQLTKLRPRYEVTGVPVFDMLTALRNKGYQNFDLVTMKDKRGTYLVRGLDRRGKAFNIQVDARNGRILSAKPTSGYQGPNYVRGEYRDFALIQKSLERQNYSRFTDVVAFDDYYSLKARDPKGRNVVLIVDSVSGKILNEIR